MTTPTTVVPSSPTPPATSVMSPLPKEETEPALQSNNDLLRKALAKTMGELAFHDYMYSKVLPILRTGGEVSEAILETFHQEAKQKQEEVGEEAVLELLTNIKNDE
jgi:hypothetical protein